MHISNNINNIYITCRKKWPNGHELKIDKNVFEKEKNMQKYIMHMIEVYHPDILQNCTEIIFKGDAATIKMKNGESLLYTSLGDGFRLLPYDSNNMTFDECKQEYSIRLKNIMYQKGISQIELAKNTNIQQSIISRYVSGATLPSFYNADKIAKALDCSLDDFRYIE